MTKTGSSKRDQRKKSIKVAHAPTLRDEPWIEDLAKKTINDDTWHCYCALIEEAKPFYRVLTKEFENICHYGYRQYVHCISMSNIIETVWVNRRESGDVTPLGLLCEEVKKFAGKRFLGKIPPNLLAAVLKYIILGLRERDLKRREASRIVKMNFRSKVQSYVSETGPKTGTQGKGKVAGRSVKPASRSVKMAAQSDKPASKKGKTATRGGRKPGSKNSELEKPKEKLLSKFHKRGEDIRCRVTVKDDPPNGPDMYIFLINFHNVFLPLELFNLGVPLTAIIQLGHSEEIIKGDTNSFRQNALLNAQKNREMKHFLMETEIDKDISKDSILMYPDIRQYWIELYLNFKNLKYSNFFKDLALVEFIPSLPSSPEDDNAVEHFRIDMYNGLVGIMYNIVCLKNMYDMYLKKTNLIDVSCKETTNMMDLKFYNDTLNSFPQDTVTVGLMLDTLICQVCFDKSEYIGYHIENYPFFLKDEPNIATTTVCLNELIEQRNYENDMFEIDVEEEDKEKTVKLQEEKLPTILTIKEDEIGVKTIYLPEDQRDFIKGRSLYLMENVLDQRFLNRTIELYPPTFFKIYTDQLASYVNASFGDDIITTFTSLSEIGRSFVFEKEDLLNPGYFLKEQVVNDRESFSINYIENVINELTEYNQNKFDNLLNRFDVLRKMNHDVLLQEVYKQLIESSYMKYKYFPLVGKIICKFYDTSVPRKMKALLPTRLTLREFIESVFFDDLVQHENLKEELDKCVSNFSKDELNFFDKDFSEKLEFPISVNNQKLKYQDCIPHNAEYEGLILELTEREDREQILDMRLLPVDGDSNEAPITFNESFLYDIGTPERTEFSYSDLELSFNKGLQMKVKYVGPIRENLSLMFVAKFNGLHSITFHSEICSNGNREDSKYVKPKFLVEHSSGVIFSLNKANGFKDPEINADTATTENEWFKMGYTSFSMPFKKCLPTFNLTISWPSGLFITVNFQTKSEAYIKQRYLDPHVCPSTDFTGELYRCYIQDGAVIKFNQNGSFELLYSSGKIIYCYEFKWLTNDIETDNVGQKLNLTNSLSIEMTKYRIRYPDGKIVIYNEGEFSTEKCLVLEVFDDLPKGKRILECSDDFFIYQQDGYFAVLYSDGTVITSHARFRSNPFFIGDNIVNLEADELKKESSIATSNSETTGSLWNQEVEEEEEGFVVIVIDFYKIQNPHFATTIFDLRNEEIIIEQPNGVVVKYFDNGNISIELGKELSVFTCEDTILVEEYFHNSLRNKIIFSIDEVESNETPQKNWINFSDALGNSMLIDIRGDIKIDKLNSSSNVGDILNEYYFTFDEKYNGVKYLTTDEMTKTLQLVKKIEDSNVFQRENDTFMEYLGIVPFNVEETWVHKLNNLEEDVFNTSTYGPSWGHPFKIKDPKDKLSTIRGFTLQLFKKINYGYMPRQEFQKMLTQFTKDFKNNLNLLHGISAGIKPEPTPLDQLLVQDVEFAERYFREFYENPPPDCKAVKTKDWIERKLVLRSIVEAIYTARLKRVAQKSIEMKKKIIDNQIPPYFESSEGTSFLLMDNIQAEIREKHKRKRFYNKLDVLLNMSLKNITSQDLEELDAMLSQDNQGIWVGKESEYTLSEVLEAGKGLSHYFENIKAVLEFHKHSRSTHTCNNSPVYESWY